MFIMIKDVHQLSYSLRSLGAIPISDKTQLAIAALMASLFVLFTQLIPKTKLIQTIITRSIRYFQLSLGGKNFRPFYLPSKYHFIFISLVGYTLFLYLPTLMFERGSNHSPSVIDSRAFNFISILSICTFQILQSSVYKAR